MTKGLGNGEEGEGKGNQEGAPQERQGGKEDVTREESREEGREEERAQRRKGLEAGGEEGREESRENSREETSRQDNCGPQGTCPKSPVREHRQEIGG